MVCRLGASTGCYSWLVEGARTPLPLLLANGRQLLHQEMG